MTLALIPARAGSKGIKNKNLALLNDKPLLYYTIQAAKNASCIDKIVLSSDGDAILDYGKSQNIEILKRPLELALDDTTSDKVILHALKSYPQYDTLILLQPTSPLRESSDIDEAYKLFIQTDSNALISVKECDNTILKAFVVEEGRLKGICNDTYPFMPRQKLPQTYMSNGAIYIVQSKLFRENPSFLQSKTQYYVMNELKSVDIDTLQDLQKANMILQKSK